MEINIVIFEISRRKYSDFPYFYLGILNVVFGDDAENSNSLFGIFISDEIFCVDLFFTEIILFEK